MGVARATQSLDLLVIFEESINEEYYQPMMSLHRLRELEPKLVDKSDAEVAKIRDFLYESATLALDCYEEQKKN